MSDELEDVLGEIDARTLAPFYLVAGEEFLVRKAADELVKRLLPEGAMSLNYSVMDGASPREVAQDLATLPLFPGRKIVLLRDPEFIAPKKGRGDALGKAREAWRAGRRKEAARRLLALAARAGWGPADLDPSQPGAPSTEKWSDELNIDLGEVDLAFLKEVALFCREENISAPESDVSGLLAVLERGLPEGQVLLIAASEVDAKNPLVRWAAEEGRLIERRVAARLKDVDLTEIAAQTLGSFKKRMSKEALALLKDRCGGNMRLVQSELEKLALHAEKPVIEVADVELLVGRAREEEFLELSDALQKRDLEAALRYAEDAIEQGSHPLQLLGAMASITRTLLENHERMQHLSEGRPPRSFDDFKGRVFPKIEEEAKAQKQRVPHPYAAFMSMQAAARFSRPQLLSGLVACSYADMTLKSSTNGKLVIERLLWSLCGQAPYSDVVPRMKIR